MEKLRKLAIIARLKTMFRSESRTRAMSVHLVWRLIVGTTLIAAIVLCVFAWLAYGWAIAEEALPISPPRRDPFSIDELRHVVELYQKKETNFAQLKNTRPQAPVLGAGTVVGVGN